MNAKTRLLIGFLTLVAATLVGNWFAHNYYRVGPESMELLVLVGGGALIIAVAAFGFLQLVRGIKRLDR